MGGLRRSDVIFNGFLSGVYPFAGYISVGDWDGYPIIFAVRGYVVLLIACVRVVFSTGPVEPLDTVGFAGVYSNVRR